MDRSYIAALLALETFQVAFLLLHDWVPLGSLNDVEAVGRLDSLSKRVQVTLYSALPYLFGLAFSCIYASAPRYPGWVRSWLWWSYGLLFAGQLWAWWIPYLVRPDRERAARYQGLFGKTHSFLPARNGIVPNTLHLILHVSTVATLLLLWWA